MPRYKRLLLIIFSHPNKKKLLGFSILPFHQLLTVELVQTKKRKKKYNKLQLSSSRLKHASNQIFIQVIRIYADDTCKQSGYIAIIILN